MGSMDGAAYMARWRERIAAMERSGKYEIRWKPNGGSQPGDPEDIEHELVSEPGMSVVRIPDDFRSFYIAANGFYLYWVSEVKADTDMKSIARGQALIAHLSQLYEPVDRLERGEPGPIPYNSLYEDYRVLDYIAGEDQVVLRFCRERQDPDFYYYVQGTQTYHRLSLDFASYMDLLVESRGLRRWQQFFIADPQARIAPDWAEWFHANLARLFPDADASRFRR